jgi:hypothetical protein
VGLGGGDEDRAIGCFRVGHFGIEGARSVACGEEGDECGFGGGALDDAVALEGFGEAEGVAAPVDDAGFEFGGGGAGGPEHAVDVEAGARDLAEDAGS